MGRKAEQVEAEAQLLGLTIRPDWANRPALSVDEARALASGQARRRPRPPDRLGGPPTGMQGWRAGRDQAARDAARKIRDQAGRGVPAGRVAAEAQRAATDAAKDYERTVPRPRFNGTTAQPLEYITPEEAPHDRIRRRRRAGRRPPHPEIFKSLCDHSGLTRAQLDHVAKTEGIPTAIRYAVWKARTAQPGPAHGRGPPPVGRVLRIHVVTRGFWRRQTHPGVERFGHVAAAPGEAWSGSGSAPFLSRRPASAQDPRTAPPIGATSR